MEMATEKTLKRLRHHATTKTDLPALAAQTLALQTADKFRLAAMLLDVGMSDLAAPIGERACHELELSKLLGQSPRPPLTRPKAAD
jgi:hypothetical protein